ncbi:MAG: hypothetical protein HC927_06220 [Deltaproteobacteria bacterium]|nr:hypothetical protein [Deltaproteobacteria bacterium]
MATSPDGPFVLVHNGCGKLRRALGGANIAPGYEAHHIVAKNAKRARPAKEVLDKFGIDLDSAINGVLLPGNKSLAKATGQAYHKGLHTNAYYAAVNRLLGGATSKNGAIRILKDIADQLSAGKIPN